MSGDGQAPDARIDWYLRYARTIVDLGCGDGSWLDSHLETEGIGVDIAPPDAGNNSEQHRRWSFIQADLDHGIPLEDGRADGIRANQVIEHIRNPLRFVTEVRRVLRPGGVFVATTPNIRYLRHIVRLALRGQGPMTSQRAARTATDWDDGHIHFFTVDDLEWLALAAGFAAFRTEALIDLSGRLSALRRALNGARRNGVVKGLLSGNLLLVARK